ncbi:MAG: hypothetical protein JWQ76_3178 [Ramlibacter sp.]|nr:hypothetical protein [Ramlibacter sp.]
MHRLRHVPRLARLVLAWFALALLAAAASPLVRGESLELVCTSAGGMKLLVDGEGGAVDPGGHKMDCQLCASLTGPPPVHRLAVAPPTQLAHALRPAVAAHIAWLTAAPLPARGPPQHS